MVGGCGQCPGTAFQKVGAYEFYFTQPKFCYAKPNSTAHFRLVVNNEQWESIEIVNVLFMHQASVHWYIPHTFPHTGVVNILVTQTSN